MEQEKSPIYKRPQICCYRDALFFKNGNATPAKYVALHSTLLTVIFFHLEQRERERPRGRRRKEILSPSLENDVPAGIDSKVPNSRVPLCIIIPAKQKRQSERGFDLNLCIANERSRLDFPLLGFVWTFFWTEKQKSRSATFEFAFHFSK